MPEIHVTQKEKGFFIEVNQTGVQKQNVGFSPGFPEAVTLALHFAKTRNIPEDRVLFQGVKVREVLKQ
jgi:hypothetical protein